MKKYIEIDGVSFEFKKGLYIKKSHELKTLDSCYNNWSTTKEYIYHEWRKFSVDNNSCDWYGIASHNCMTFTFDAMITHEEKQYYIHITKAHNYIMEVNE